MGQPAANTHRPDFPSPTRGGTDRNQSELGIGDRRPSPRFDPDGVIADLFDHTSRLVGIDGGIVFTLNQDNHFVPQWSREVNHRAVVSLPPLDLADSSMLTRCTTEHAVRMWQSNPSQPEPDDWLQLLGWGQAVAVPLMSDQIGIGVFLAGWVRHSRLNPEAVAILEAAAAHAASALDGARLFQELRREEQRLRSLIDATPLPMLVVDTTTKTVTWTNDEAKSLLGDVTGQSYQRVADDRQAVTLQEMPVAETPTTSADAWPPTPGTRIQLTDTGGNTRVVAPTTARLNDTESLLILHDVTAETRIDQTRSRFLRMVSHHLRTPLTPLLGYVTLLGEHLTPATDPLVDEAISMMTETLAGMVTEVGRLEQVAAVPPPGSADRRTIAARELIVDAWRQAKGNPGQLVIEGDAEQTLVCSPDRITAALVELFDNALTHGTPPVTLTIGHHPDTTRFYIEDEGVGIPPEWAEEIFAPYVSAADGYRAATPGHHGLGLTLARLNVEAASGTLTYDAAHRTFVITL